MSRPALQVRRCAVHTREERPLLRIKDAPHIWDACATASGVYVCAQKTHSRDTIQFISHWDDAPTEVGLRIASSVTWLQVWVFEPKEIPFSMCFCAAAGLLAIGTYSGP